MPFHAVHPARQLLEDAKVKGYNWVFQKFEKNGGKDVFAWWVRHLQSLSPEEKMFFQDKNEAPTLFKCCKGKNGVLWLNCPD
eukprot:SAG22_NODE_84_length_21617_cov_48.600102_6_plen_82_part_00